MPLGVWLWEPLVAQGPALGSAAWGWAQGDFISVTQRVENLEALGAVFC